MQHNWCNGFYNEFGFIVSKNPNVIVKKSFYRSERRVFIKTEILDKTLMSLKVSETWRKLTDENIQLEFSNVTFNGKSYDLLKQTFESNVLKIKSNAPDYCKEFYM